MASAVPKYFSQMARRAPHKVALSSRPKTAPPILSTHPSISAEAGRRKDVGRAAGWLAESFAEIGLAVEIIPTKGHPLVLAESPRIEGAATVLVYGHYDVQPPDPLERWTAEPFTPTVRDGCVHARGASDDKSGVMIIAAALRLFGGEPPVGIKVLIEGEEETGSSIEDLVAANPSLVQCDAFVINDGGNMKLASQN